MDRRAFTMVELIFVIVIIGVLAGMAVPKFSGVKDRAKSAAELSTASSVAAALESIHGTWSVSEEDFDWNGDGITDDIAQELSSHGYPYDLSRNGDPLGALLKSSSRSGFKIQKSLTSENSVSYILYTAKASDPVHGIPYPLSAEGRDTAGQPDKNDFWLYVIDANGTHGCQVSSDHSETKKITVGDFMLIDVNGTLPVDFTDAQLGIGFSIGCS